MGGRKSARLEHRSQTFGHPTRLVNGSQTPFEHILPRLRALPLDWPMSQVWRLQLFKALHNKFRSTVKWGRRIGRCSPGAAHKSSC